MTEHDPDYYTVSITHTVPASSFEEAARKFIHWVYTTEDRTVLVEHGYTDEQRYVEA